MLFVIESFQLQNVELKREAFFLPKGKIVVLEHSQMSQVDILFHTLC